MTDDNSIYLTKDGIEELKKELKQIKDIKLPALIDRVSNAREQGDLSENADYSNSKEELTFVEGRIEELEGIIARAKVIKNNGKKNKSVELGSKLTVSVKGKEYVYTVVGEWEADPLQKKISHDSPLGKSLIGRKEGDIVEVEAPAGTIAYNILKIH